MTEKLSEYEITSRDGPFINAECNTKIINTLVRKINELVDSVNKQQIQLNNHECRLLDLHSRITALDDPTYHEAPTDQYAEQRKWRGKLCKFWDDSDKPENCVYGVLCNIFDPFNLHHEDCPFQCENGEWYEYCEPVKPEDNIIYKE